MARYFTRHCEICGSPFQTCLGNINRGGGRFCSQSCAGLNQRQSLIDRFFNHIGRKTATGCILWAGSKSRQISSGGKRSRQLVVARVAYEILVGPIPDGMCVCHTCDNGHLPCINPVHLFLGTHANNMADRNAKGRQARGVMIPHAKLTDEKVREIRARGAAGETIVAIAKRFGISSTTATHIIARKKWAHVA